MIKEHDRVVLTTAVPGEGQTAAVVTLEASPVCSVAPREITHARLMAG